MPSPLRWICRRIEIHKIGDRRKEIEAELASEWSKPVRLVPASAKGGYDEIFYLLERKQRIGMVRLNSPFKKDIDPITPLDPSVPLGPAARLEREWSAYKALSEHGLSPEPLWRTRDAIATSWLPAERLSMRLAGHREEFWTHLFPTMKAVRSMHDSGITHLDLNTGNLLVSPNGGRIFVIDFEFGPVEWLRKNQEFAFDYLRLIDDFTKPRRGGRQMLEKIDRLIDVLDECVFPEARQAPCGFALKKLSRLARTTELHAPLQRVFKNLTT